MSVSRSRRLARRIVRAAAAGSSPATREWIVALGAEIEHAGDGLAAIAWALGAARLAAGDRVREAARAAPLLATAGAAALAIALLDARASSRVPLAVLSCALAGGLAFARPRIALFAALATAPAVPLVALATGFAAGPYAHDRLDAAYPLVFVPLAAAAGALARRARRKEVPA